MKDHKSRLRTHQSTFTGQEFVGWLVEKKEVSNNDEAVLLGQALLENGVMHHSELWGCVIMCNYVLIFTVHIIMYNVICHSLWWCSVCRVTY